VPQVGEDHYEPSASPPAEPAPEELPVDDEPADDEAADEAPAIVAPSSAVAAWLVGRSASPRCSRSRIESRMSFALKR
jgi:hypothetical protein